MKLTRSSKNIFSHNKVRHSFCLIAENTTLYYESASKLTCMGGGGGGRVEEQCPQPSPCVRHCVETKRVEKQPWNGRAKKSKVFVRELVSAAKSVVSCEWSQRRPGGATDLPATRRAALYWAGNRLLATTPLSVASITHSYSLLGPLM
jgi:hypothetical protein